MKIRNQVIRLRRRRRRISSRLSKGIIVASVCLVASGGCLTMMQYGITMIERLSLFAVKKIDVHFKKRAPYNLGYTENAIVALSGITYGTPIFSVDLLAARQRLLALPWIRDVAIKRRPPASIQINVTEREARYLLNRSGLYYLDREGNIVEPAGRYMDLPTIRISEAIPEGDRKSFIDRAMTVINFSRRINIDVSEVFVDKDGVISMVLNSDRAVVHLGRGDLSTKMRRLDQIRKDLIRKMEVFSVIDVSFEDFAIVKRQSSM